MAKYMGISPRHVDQMTLNELGAVEYLIKQESRRRGK